MSIRSFRFLAFALLASVFGGSALQAVAPESARVTPLVRAVEKIMPSVVSIGTRVERYVRLRDPYRSDFERFFGGPEGQLYQLRKYQPLGSGVIVDASGLILTNYHVVENQSPMLVNLVGGESFPARMVAHNHASDLCLLALERPDDAPPLVPAAFGVPDDLLLGETVVTVGNPFGFQHSVSQGVLSARNRIYQRDGLTFRDLLQTDAAINPGNSGGPLINLDGELIGINNAIRRDSEGIGFAIPVSRIESFLAKWMVPARRTDCVIGLIPGTGITHDGTRAVVLSTTPGSPAAAAKLSEGAVIETVNGTRVHRAIDVSRELFRVPAGGKVELGMASGATVEVAARAMTPSELSLRRLGLRLQPLTPALRSALRLPPQLTGLVIAEVMPDSDLAMMRARNGLELVRRGDIVEGIEDRPVADLEQLDRALRKTVGGMPVLINLMAIDTINGQPYPSRVKATVTVN
jgi:S1-C subfamily serine protease